MTLELPEDLPTEDNNTFYLVNVFNFEDPPEFPPEDLFNLSNQRHTLKVHNKYLGEESFSMFAIGIEKISMIKALSYAVTYCKSFTINILE